MADQPVSVTTQRTCETLDAVALANHCQAGAVIALSAALAAALGQATANGTLEEGPTPAAADAARNVQRRLSTIRARLQTLADADAVAINAFVRLREAGQTLQGYAVLCDGPREMAELALDAAALLQAFRAHVCERTHDDLEFAITLLSSAARGAVQLLDSNLRIWPLPALLAQYDPAVNDLLARVAALTPVARIR
jgi:formiminotetrahydrofolate cyclodeaminase